MHLRRSLRLYPEYCLFLDLLPFDVLLVHDGGDLRLVELGADDALVGCCVLDLLEQDSVGLAILRQIVSKYLDLRIVIK